MIDASADLILTGGKVVTLDPAGRIVEAIAVKAGRLAAVGRNDDVARLAGPATRRIDARGRLVVPGLIDGHAHMDREGLKEILPSLAHCRSIDDILQVVEAACARTPPGEWVVTMPVGAPPFYEDVPDCLKERRFPTRHDLDRVSPRHPVYIRAIWGHWRNTLPLVSVANTLALERAGITRTTMPPAPSIQIDKDPATGEPNGILTEFTYKPLVEKTLLAGIPRFTLDDRLRGLRRSMQVYASYGTTSVYEGHGIAGEVLAAYQLLREAGPLPVRSHLVFSPAWPSTEPAAIRDLLADWGRWLAGRGMGDEFLRMSGLYTESEWNVENRLRAMCGPYTGWAGFNFDCALPEAAMIELMAECARLRIRVGSFGPRTLEFFARANAMAPIAGQRWILEHVGMFSRDEIARIRDLGLVLQAYSSRWIEDDGEMLLAAHGPEGCERVLPMRELIDAGIHVSLATDNVPPTLFPPIAHVVTRLTGKGSPIGPGQAISRLEALAAASREGAWLTFEEGDKGTLEPGRLADFAVLSEDLLTVPDERIRGIVAEVTVTGGRIVHEQAAAG